MWSDDSFEEVIYSFEFEVRKATFDKSDALVGFADYFRNMRAWFEILGNDDP